MIKFEMREILECSADVRTRLLIKYLDFEIAEELNVILMPDIPGAGYPYNGSIILTDERIKRFQRVNIGEYGFADDHIYFSAFLRNTHGDRSKDMIYHSDPNCFAKFEALIKEKTRELISALS